MIMADREDIKKAIPNKTKSIPKQIGFLEILKGPEEISFSGVPSGIKVVSIFLINRKLKNTRNTPPSKKINPNKEFKSVETGKVNKSISCKIIPANKMTGGKLIFINLIYQKKLL